jgi:hypothetical protein
VKQETARQYYYKIANWVSYILFTFGWGPTFYGQLSGKGENSCRQPRLRYSECYHWPVMAHPEGGSGGTFEPKNPFTKVYDFVGMRGVTFPSTTGEQIEAAQGMARDKRTKTIVFRGERTKHGSACSACWGFRTDCNQSWVGQCAEALDKIIR